MEIEDAVRLLKENAAAVKDAEYVELEQARGRILFEDVKAPINLPPFDKSAMDGYAVRSEDVKNASLENPVSLGVVAEVFAGCYSNIKAVRESAVRVMTGSFIPSGYDCVVKQEDTDYGEENVCIYDGAKAFQNICKKGEDVKKGETVLKKGRRIGRIESGILAGLGFSKVRVFARPKLALLCSGSELTEPGNPLLPGKIYSNLKTILSYSIKNAGFELVISKNIEDEEVLLTKEIENALSLSDFLITTGGVSVGKKDLLPKVMEKLGAKKLFSDVNIQPGTPTAAYVLEKKIILCLSGNPYAAIANFDIYFYQIASVMLSCTELQPERESAVLKSSYDKINSRRRLVRAFVQSGTVIIPSENHAASVIKNLLECNCYIDLPARKKVRPGDRVEIIMMKD